MIAYLKGRIVEMGEDRCVLLTGGGVGYEVFIPSSSATALLRGKDEVSLYIKMVVREDSLELYGFLSPEEKALFSKLIGISKLGPKTAMCVLSHLTPQMLYEAVVKEDIKSLSQVPGIGKKTASRIIWELKDSISPSEATTLLGAGHHPADQQGRTFSDALSALVNLGYEPAEVEPILRDVLTSEPDLMVEEAVRAVLRLKNPMKDS